MTNPAPRYAMGLLSILEATPKCQSPRGPAISQMPKSTKSSHDNMNLGISSPNLSSQQCGITIISVNPKPDTIRAHLVSSTPKTNMELSIHVKNLLQIFILIALGIYWVELICELNRLFFLLCWLFSKTVSCSHAGHPLLPRASYPNVHLRLWCQERFHWLSPWGLTSETQMRLGCKERFFLLDPRCR